MKKLSAEVRLTLSIVIGVWWSLGICVALFNQFTDCDHHYDKSTACVSRENCVYRSLGGFTNLGYVVTCELFRQRFEIGK